MPLFDLKLKCLKYLGNIFKTRMLVYLIIKNTGGVDLEYNYIFT